MTLVSFYTIRVEVYDPNTTPDQLGPATSRQLMGHFYLDGGLTTNKRLAQRFRPSSAQAALSQVASDEAFEAHVRSSLVLPQLAEVRVRLEETTLTQERS